MFWFFPFYFSKGNKKLKNLETSFDLSNKNFPRCKVYAKETDNRLKRVGKSQMKSDILNYSTPQYKRQLVKILKKMADHPGFEPGTLAFLAPLSTS